MIRNPKIVLNALIFKYSYFLSSNIISGILYFAVFPNLKTGDWQTFLLDGALLGLLCYATYDLTNMATLKNWPWTMVFVDIAWGIVLTGCTALASGLIAQKWLGM